jgi:hypothetical protein
VFQFSDWETRITQGQGEAYGLELFLQKKKGRFNGWIGYTLSWAWRQFEELNFGDMYPYRFDRRHDFEIVGSYQFNERVRLSGTWVFATGNAVTFGTSRYQAPDAYNDWEYTYTFVTEHTPERNNFRYPNYHRFDIGLDLIKKKKHHTRTWSFGAYNMYNRNNPFFLFLDTEYVDDGGNTVEKSTLRQASLFPIIPYITYSFKF